MKRKYYHQNISKIDVKNLIKDIKSFGLYIIPIDINSDSEIGYQISDERGIRLTFRENRLPKGYDFNKMWEIVSSRSNLENVVKAGINPSIIIGDRNKYLAEKKAA